MKLDKLAMFYLIVAIIVISVMTGFYIGKNTQKDELYSLTTVVTDINEETDTVLTQDANGFVWCFYGVEDWCIGDIASCVMNTKGTQKIFDDEIISIRYCGQFEMWD